MTWDGGDYQARFDNLAGQGKDVHGEAAFVDSLRPASVLDAGCGTGRVAIELARRGVEVAGVDNDPSMLAVAKDRAPELTWIEADLAELDLGRTFHVVVMAGNVLLFVTSGTEAAVVARTAAHVEPGGALVAGFQLRPGGYDLVALDEAATKAGLVLEERFSTWDRATYNPDSDYAVTVFRHPSSAFS